MSFFIDIIAAIIAGGIIIFTIITSLFNVRQTSHNIEAFLTVNNNANHITKIIDNVYLEKVGLNLNYDEIATLTASRTEFQFTYKNFPNDINLQTYHLQMLTDENNNNFLVVTLNGVEEFNSHPFFFESRNIFSYFDENFNTINFVGSTIPNNLLENIYGTQVELVFISDAWSNDANQQIRYPLTFWRYFKNVYLVKARVL